ncbi:MAG: mechanosensitive ion channel [Pontixanthobacter sp.]
MQVGNYRFDQDVAMNVLEKIVLVIVILVVTWALAKAAKWAFAKLVDNVRFFQRGTGNGGSLGASLGKIVSLFIWLFGFIAILQVLDLGGVMAPIQGLLNDVLGFIPNLIGAALIFFIGMMVAGIVRDIVVTSLQTVDFDKWLNRGGAETVTGNSRISSTIGTIIYVLIIIPVAILALEALNLETVSEPASNMLREILGAIPNIITAAILLGIGYVISKFVVGMLKDILIGLGVDRSLDSAGVLPAGASASGFIARIAQIAIILAFAVMATRALGFPEITAMLSQILELAGQVVFGAVVIAAGFIIGNVLARIIGGEDEQGMGATIVKYAAIVLFTFMGLTFMGVGDEIVQMAFGALVIGGGVAIALAFGLGGREWAGRKLEELDQKVRDGSVGGGSTGGSSTKAAAPKSNTRTKTASKSDKPLPPGA